MSVLTLLLLYFLLSSSSLPFSLTNSETDYRKEKKKIYSVYTVESGYGSHHSYWLPAPQPFSPLEPISPCATTGPDPAGIDRISSSCL